MKGVKFPNGDVVILNIRINAIKERIESLEKLNKSGVRRMENCMFFGDEYCTRRVRKALRINKRFLKSALKEKEQQEIMGIR